MNTKSNVAVQHWKSCCSINAKCGFSESSYKMTNFAIYKLLRIVTGISNQEDLDKIIECYARNIILNSTYHNVFQLSNDIVDKYSIGIRIILTSTVNEDLCKIIEDSVCLPYDQISTFIVYNSSDLLSESLSTNSGMSIPKISKRM